MESVMGSVYIHIKIKFLLQKLGSIKGFMIQIKILNKQKLPDISSIAVFSTWQDVSYSWDLMVGFVGHEVS
jgi:hypothetical protein